MLMTDKVSVDALIVRDAARAVPTVLPAPQLSAAASELLREIQVVDETGQRRAIQLPLERALTLRVDGREFVTLMTLGAAPELLVLGYLINQRLITRATEVESIVVDWASGSAMVRTRAALGGTPSGVPRERITISAQGTALELLVAHSEAVPMPSADAARIGKGTLESLLETMQQHQDIHRSAGSVHSCALFHGAELWLTVEDVARHNAVDTISGWMALYGVSGGDKILFTTGRLTGEMVLKAALSGVPIAVSRNGVSAMGYELALRFGMTLFGRAAKGRFICYVGAERFDAD
jgi:FdhD protein